MDKKTYVMSNPDMLKYIRDIQDYIISRNHFSSYRNFEGNTPELERLKNVTNKICDLLDEELTKDYFDKDKHSYEDSDFKKHKKEIIKKYLSSIISYLKNQTADFSAEVLLCAEKIKDELLTNHNINETNIINVLEEVLTYHIHSLKGVHCSNYNHSFDTTDVTWELNRLWSKITTSIWEEINIKTEN